MAISERPLFGKVDLHRYIPAYIDQPASVVYTQNFTSSTDGWTGYNVSRLDQTLHVLITGSDNSADDGIARRVISGLVPGAAYTFEAKSYTGQSGSSSAVGVTGIASGTLKPLPVTTWTTRTMTFVATATSHEFLLRGSATSTLWDDVKLTRIAWKQEVEGTWVSNGLDHATNVSIRRGGVRDGLGIKTDVGLMNFTLHNDEDPLDGGTIEPGQIIQAVAGDGYIPGYDETVYSYGFEDYAETSYPASTVYSEDFESGTLNGWAIQNPNAAVQIDPVGYDGSAYSIRVTNAVSGTGRAHRTVTGLTVGRTYTLYARQATEGAGAFTIGVEGIGATDPSYSYSWAEMSYTFTATATSHVLQLMSYSSTAGRWTRYDDVRLVRHAFTTVTNDGLDGWATQGGSGITASVLPEYGQGFARSGKGVLSVSRASGTTALTVARNFTGLTIGSTYTLRAWIKETSTFVGTRTASLSITGVGSSTSITTPAVWGQVSYAFTATSTSHTAVLTATQSNSGSYMALWDDVELVENIPAVETREPIFTGRVAHIQSNYPLNKETGKSRTSVTVTVADAVQIHGSTMRYGVDLGAETNETFEDRIERLEASANAPVEIPAVGAPIVRYEF